jgi:hypothetical protein
MPKCSHHRKQRGGHFGGHFGRHFGGNFGSPPAALVAFMAPPRKVSFEDGHYDTESDSTSPDPSSSRSSPAPVVSSNVLPTSEPAPLSRKSSLIRHKSSLSLVELAKDDVEEEGTSTNCNWNDDAGVSLSAPVSPMLSPQRTGGLHFSSPATSPSTSPWGHFVDMVLAIPEEEEGAAHRVVVASHQQYHHHSQSCSRRRANPYGDYKKNRDKQRRPLCFLQEELDSHSSWSSTQHSPRGFRLTPRKKEPTDQLIGALDRLQVD